MGNALAIEMAPRFPGPDIPYSVPSSHNCLGEMIFHFSARYISMDISVSDDGVFVNTILSPFESAHCLPPVYPAAKMKPRKIFEILCY